MLQKHSTASTKKAMSNPLKCGKIRKSKRDYMKRSREDPIKGPKLRKTDKSAKEKRLHKRNTIKNEKEIWPPTITDETIKLCIEEFKKFTSSSALSVKCCAVCGMESHKTTDMSIKDLPNKHILKVSEGITSLEEYIHFGLILVSKGLEGTTVTCCHDCKGCLEKAKLPPFSAANDLQYGTTPEELRGLTIGEKLLIAIVRPSVHVIKFKEIAGPGTGQKGVKGNSICFPQSMDSVCSAVFCDTLPHDIGSLCDTMKVIFTGARKPTRGQLHNVLHVRRQKVSDALVWLKKHHHLYKDVKINQTRMKKIPKNDIPECIWRTVSYEEKGRSEKRSHKTNTNTSIDEILTDVYSSDEKGTPNEEIIVETTGMIDMFASTVSTTDQSQLAASHILDGDREKKEDKIHIIPHGPKPVIEYFNPDLWTGSYPWLFPFGIGGAEVKRRASLSIRAWIRVLMLQADSKFRDDIKFLVHVFNVIQKREVSLQTALCLRHPKFSQVSNEISNITSQKLERALQGIAKKEQMDPEIQTLMRQIHVVGGKIPGTPYAKRISRHEIHGLMIKQGMPAFWVTLNPADVHSPIVCFLAGYDIDLDAQFPNVPSSHERARIAAEHPVECARFFDIIVRAFIDCILRYNKSGGGVLGNVSAFYGCPEEQGRGALHLHMLVWIEGYTSPTELRRMMSENTDFKEKVLAHLQAVIRQHSPFADQLITNHVNTENEEIDEMDDSWEELSETESDINESVCSSDDEAMEISFASDECNTSSYEEGDYDSEIEEMDDSWEELSESESDIAESVCSSSDEAMEISFASDECNTSSYEEGDSDSDSNESCSSINSEEMETSCVSALEPSNKDRILTSSVPDTTSPNFEQELNLQVDQLIPFCCIHRHNLSCYKHGDHKSCRYDYPRCIVHESEVDGEEIKLKRLHRWINNFERTTLACIKSNMDIQFIGSGKACRSAAFYMCDYQTKSGMSAHNALSLIQGSVKKVEVNQEQHKYADEDSRSTALVVKCTNKIISEREMSAPHVASLLLGGNDKYTSHSFRSLNILSFLSRIHDENDESDLHEQSLIQRSSSGIVLLNDCNDYMLRGSSLSNMSLFQYISCIEKITKKSESKLKGNRDGKPGRPQNERFEYDKDHPQSTTHIQRNRSVELVPRLTYLPPSPESNPEKYAKCMLILFKPFTNLENLKQRDRTWMEEYIACDFDDNHKKWISHIREMHAGLAEKSKLDEEYRSAHEDVESLSDDECYYLSDDEEYDEWMDEFLFNANTTEVEDDDKDTTEAMNIICRAKGFPSSNVPNSKSVRLKDDSSTSNVTIKTWKSHIEHSKKASNDNGINNVNFYEEQSVQFDKQRITSKQNEIETVNGTSVIEDITRKFTLNQKQAKAFNLIASNVIKRYNGEATDQILMYLGGAAGTGKTRVIKAIEYLHEVLGIRFALKLAAYTGTASGEIGGNTLSSLAQISRRIHAKSDVQKLEETWKYVSLLVIDEVSMIACPMLAKLHRNLIHAKHDSTNAPFAGMDMLYVGDFNQHPPIRSPALFYGSDPNTHVKPMRYQSDIDRECGKALWHQLTHVVLLTEQNRVEDRRYSEMLSRIAEGNGTITDYCMLNTRLVANIDLQQEKFLNAPIIVPGNQLRMKMNRVHAVHKAEELGQKVMISIAKDTCSRHSLSASKLRQLQKLSYNATTG